MVTFGIVIFVIMLILFEEQNYIPSIDWGSMNPILLEVLPWALVLLTGFSLLIYLSCRRN